MAGDGVPLSALLSQVLVAYTIEFDNEAEHRMPHRTTDGGAGQGPWLFSLAMWANSVRLMPTDGDITIEELARLARTDTNVDGIRRWGYVTVTRPDGTRIRAGMKRPRGCSLRLTAAGRLAQAGWAPLTEEIDARWRERIGAPAFRALRAALSPLADPALPDPLPIIGFALRQSGPVEGAPPGQPAADLPLWALLSRALTGLARTYEATAEVSLAIAANLLRVLENTLPVRELPATTGLSKEIIAMAAGWLGNSGFAQPTPLPSGRGKQLSLTEAGHRERERYLGWVDHQRNPELLAALEPITQGPALQAGLTPYPDNWRAARERNGRGTLARRTPVTLPHFPAVTHRGGFPDGS